MSRPRTGPGPIGAVAVLAALALGATACTAGDSGSNQDVGKAGVDQPTTIEFWHFFTDREAKVIQGAVDDFHKKNPKITTTCIARPRRARRVTRSPSRHQNGRSAALAGWIRVGQRPREWAITPWYQSYDAFGVRAWVG